MTEGMTATEFFIGMLQFVHNRDHPEHRCECKSLQEMVTLHFDYHLKEKIED